MNIFRSRNRISFFVGPNGCGKTQQLIKIQEDKEYTEKVASITNATFNRFARSTPSKPVLRVSPRAVERTTGDNLAHFFDSEGRDTFDISDLLDEIGFHSEIKLVVKFNSEWDGNIYQIIKNTREASYIDDIFRKFVNYKSFETILTQSSDSYEKSFRGNNRVIFKHMKLLKRKGVVKDYQLIFNHKDLDRGEQNFSSLSSGEQTLITTFLFIRSSLKNMGMLLIDEPENSLHPRWQRKYLEFIHMAIGYSDVQIIVATHSPIIVSGAIEGYKNSADVYSVVKDQFNQILFDGENDSVEEILLDAFDTITPSSSHLSEIISEITWDVQEGRIDKETAIKKLKDLMKKSYSESQKSFIIACENIINKL